MSKKILMVIIIVIAVVAVLVGFFALRGKAPIKIGAILPLTGPAEYYGEEARDGLLLAIDEVNSRGGINGRKIELIIEDSKTDPEEGKAAFNRIEDEHHPLLYISATSLNCLPLAPVAEENEVVFIGLITAAPELTEGKEWVFRYCYLAEDETAPILTIVEELGVKNLGVMYEEGAYGVSILELTEEGLAKTGGTVKAESLELKEANYKEKVAKLEDMEAIYVAGYGYQIENTFKQLREINYQGHILGAHGASIPAIVNMPESNGVYVAAPKIYDPEYLFAKEVKERYESKHGKPFNSHSANGYDVIKILAELLEGKGISREIVKDLLETGFIHPGILGTIYIKSHDHDISFSLYPARIVDGELQYGY